MDPKYMVEDGGYSLDKLSAENRSFVDGFACALKVIDKYLEDRKRETGTPSDLREYVERAYYDIVVCMVDDEEGIGDEYDWF